MRKGAPRLLRWLETADWPAAVAAMLVAVSISVGFGSCAGPPRAPTARPSPAMRPSPEGVAEGEPIVRVRLLADVGEVELSGPASAILRAIDKPGAGRTVGLPAKALRVESGWYFRDAGGRAVAVPADKAGSPPPAVIIRSGDGEMLKVNDSPFPGEVILTAKESRPETPGESGLGTKSPPARPFDVIEQVPIERYLPGVISKELLPNWSLEAYKAQAIAARSYAIHESRRSRGLGRQYDIESSQLDQVYAGSVDHAVAERAVRETRGMILTFEGRVLRAYYSSTCGGRPAAARDVWPTTRGFEFNLDAPIQGTQGPEDACNFGPRWRWTATRSREDVSARLSAFGRDQGLAVRAMRSLARMEPAATTADGRPTAYRLFDSGGAWFTLSAEQVRTALNWPVPALPPITARNRIFSGDLEMTARGADFIITGRGFGHGVGMCQYGAEGLARRGIPHDRILMHYYPGARLEKAY